MTGLWGSSTNKCIAENVEQQKRGVPLLSLRPSYCPGVGVLPRFLLACMQKDKWELTSRAGDLENNLACYCRVQRKLDPGKKLDQG